MDKSITKLWKKNRVTGYWQLERICQVGNANEWLEVFKKDEPGEIFRLSKNKPNS